MTILFIDEVVGGTERISNLPEVKQLESLEAKIQAQALWPQSSCC